MTLPVPGVTILPGAMTDDVSVLELPVDPNVLPVELAWLPKILVNSPPHNIIPTVDSSRQVSSCLLRAESKKCELEVQIIYQLDILHMQQNNWTCCF